MSTDFEVSQPGKKKENPELQSKEYRELEQSLERFDDPQKIAYLKKRLTNHMCSVYIEEHPELGLIADDDPQMVGELARRIHRIQKILDDSPIYSPFLRGIKSDEYKDSGWSTRKSLAKPFLNDIQIMAMKIEGKASQENPQIPEISVSDMIYESDQKKKGELVPEVFILRGLHSLTKIQNIGQARYASDKDLSKLRANHGNYRNALRHLSRGIMNGGLSLFSVVTFGSIFDRYIQNYRVWLGIEMNAIKFSGRPEVAKMQRKIDRHIDALKNVRKNNRSIPLLRRMYGWFPSEYKYQRLRIADVKTAFKYKERGTDGKKVKGVVTRQIIAVFFNLTLFLAGSPLARLGLLLSKNIPALDTELVLRKRQIESAQMVNNYYKVFGLEAESTKGPLNSLKLLSNIVDYCDDTIKRVIDKMGLISLEKPYERDPFIKTFTVVRQFIGDYPGDKNARAMLHRFYPHAQQLLRGSAKKDQIRVAHTIVAEVEKSMHKHGKTSGSKGQRVTRAG